MSSQPLPQPAPIGDRLTALNSTPLFMKSLPEDASEDVALSALQELAYEGTPDEIAQNFKEQGNEYFQGRRYREALGFYTQGIDAKPTDPVLLEALLCNRAACNIELKNYGSVLKDCSKALTLNQRSSKGYYRSAVALLALERLDDALDCCDRCLAFDGDNKSVRDVRERVARRKAEKERKEKETQDRIRQDMEEKRRLQHAFQERNLITIQSTEETTDNPYSPHFHPESPEPTLVMPVFFLYPQHAISDTIPYFLEEAPFSAHLTAMFPPEASAPEWDQKGEYVDGNLVVYAITHRRRLLKVGKKMTLKDVYKAARGKDGEPRDGLEVKNGCMSFVVVPKGAEEKRWVDEFKQSRDK